MPEDLTKRQHYVWRNYLKPWKLSENDAGIWTLLKVLHPRGGNKIQRTQTPHLSTFC